MRSLAAALIWFALSATAALAQVQGQGVGQTGSVTANNGACWAAAGVIKDCGLVPGAGNVTGPGSAVSGNIATFNGTTGKIIQDSGISPTAIPASSLVLGQVTNVLGADVNLNNTGTYFDGPSVAQGVTGTWFASGTVSVQDTAGAANIFCKLWDGTTVVASAASFVASINANIAVTLSGYLASPAGNLRISCKDTSSTSGLIKFNATGNSKDSAIFAFRIN